MAVASKFIFTLLALATLSFTGCAAMCRNFGCNNCGPVSVGAGCDSCSNGCGEMYIDPWINHPAECCDPCDTCGNHNGQSCGTCRPVFAGIASLWGYRHADCAGCDSCAVPVGCDSCGVEDCGGCCEASCGCESCAGGVVNEGIVHEGIVREGGGGQYIEGEGRIVGKPVWTDEVAGPTTVEPYRPHRTKKIFRQRPQIAERHTH